MGQLRMKSVRRKYPFDKEGVPRGESDFLKVICSSSVHLPANLSGMVALTLHAGFGGGVSNINGCDGSVRTTGQSFSHIFGATTSATESLLIKRRLMGPGWLKITNVAEDNAKVSIAATDVGMSEIYLQLSLDVALNRSRGASSRDMSITSPISMSSRPTSAPAGACRVNPRLW